MEVTAKCILCGLVIFYQLIECLSQKEGDVRLYLGVQSTGIVEVYETDQWWSICGWNLGNKEAGVVCRHLGFADGRALPMSAYGDQPTLVPYPHKLKRCTTGTESRLLNCEFEANTTCADATVAYGSVNCIGDKVTPPVNKVRLGINGGATPYFSPVSVYNVNVSTWGRVCASFWDDADANVVCNQLGYAGGRASMWRQELSVPFLMFETNCIGNETSLDACPVRTVFCYDIRSAAVVCYNNVAPRVSLDRDGLYGRVLLSVDDESGYICNSRYHGNETRDVTSVEASVICKHLGHSAGVVIQDSFVGENSNNEVIMEGLTCNQDGGSVFRCFNNSLRNVSTQCQGRTKALAVSCSTNVKLEDGMKARYDSNVREGIPQILDDNKRWHRVCSGAISLSVASVICRQLGFDEAEILQSTSLNISPGNTDVTNITCNNSATNISGCIYTIGECLKYDGYTYYAKLFCRKASIAEDFTISLKNSYHGSVFVTRYGMEGNICAADWSDTAATVVCRQLGFTTGVSLGGSSFSPNYQFYPIWQHKFSCIGTENRLSMCPTETKVDIRKNCFDRPAGSLCFSQNRPEKTIRIDKNQIEGRVEIYINATHWGFICQSTNANVAKVICKQLGYPNGRIRGTSAATAGTLVAMASVKCDGSETSIYQCASLGWLNSNGCTESDANSISCDPYMKIEAKFYGQILVHSGTSYGLVCADTFDQNAANVACKDAGFSYGKPLCCSAFGPAINLKYTLVGTKCLGTESSLKDCPYSNGVTECPSNNYASVVCAYNQVGYTGNLKVTPAVMLTYFSHDGYICSENFTDKDAAVTCRATGFAFGFAFKHSTAGLTEHKPLRWLRSLKCQGSETSITSCGPHDWGQIGVCDIDSVAGAHCTNIQGNLDIKVRLENGTNISGRVEVKLDGQWGTLCGTDLTKNEAVVICRQLGFRDGIMLMPGQFGAGQGNILLSNIKCKGAKDSHIRDCIWSGFKQPSSLCTHNMDAAVKCFYNTRLVGSPLQNYGRLEVYDSTVEDWVLVCDRALSKDTPTQVCRQLGFATGLPQYGSPLGHSDKNIVFTEAICAADSPCNFTKGQCMSKHYVALYCSTTPINSEDLQIQLPLNAFYGPVSLKRFGLWGHICNLDFDDLDAKVICKQLNYDSGHATTTFITEGKPIIQGQVKCSGNETKIADCPRNDFSQGHNCYDFTTVAGVICYNKARGLQFYSNNPDLDSGQMKTLMAIKANNEVVYVLENNVKTQPENVAVYCESLGYAGGEETMLSTSNPTFSISEIECTGKEASILECVGDWSPSSSQSRGKSVTVTCFETVRLIGGNSSYYGVVYATKGINSGPVCANGFDQSAADLTCSDLGFQHSIIFCCSPFGTQDATPVMDNIDCSEPLSPGESVKHLTDCKHDNVDAAHTGACQKNYAAVACYNGVRPTDFFLSLSEKNSNTGYVIMTYLGIPGVICLDDWDDDDATVMCKQLGYKRGLAYNADRGSDKGPFWTSEVDCEGTETKLSDCQMTPLGTVSKCSNNLGHAGVICYDDQGIFYRLEGSNENRWGRVEISLNGEWRSLCNLYWESADAHVLCNHLGYRSGDVYSKNLPVIIGGQVWETNFQCSGTETSLNECLSSGWRESTLPSCAQHLNDAFAFCYKSVKLSTGVGRDTNHGGVLLYRDNRWYKVCGNGFNDQSARAVCRELGFAGGSAKCCSPYGSLSQFPLLTNHTISCFGDEEDVSDCLKLRTCPDEGYASVTCFDFDQTSPDSGATERVKSDFDPLPVILSVVIIVALVIIAVVVFCVYRHRKRRTPIEKTEQTFTGTSIKYQVDGSVAATNIMANIPPSPLPIGHETSHEYEAIYETSQPIYDKTINSSDRQRQDQLDLIRNPEEKHQQQDSENPTYASSNVEMSSSNPVYKITFNNLHSTLHEKAELESPRVSMSVGNKM